MKYDDVTRDVVDAVIDDMGRFVYNLSKNDVERILKELYIQHSEEYTYIIDNDDIREEFACRGLTDEYDSLSDYSDAEIEDEFEARGLITEEDNSLAREIVHGINCGKDMSMAVTTLLEQLSGMVVCPVR